MTERDFATSTRLPVDAPSVRPRRACPVCCAGASDVLHTERMVLPAGHPLTSGYDVVACRECGFVFADTVVPQAEYDRFYAELSKYADEATGTGGGYQAWDDRRLELMARTIAEAVPDRDARIVEVGCANGGLLRWLVALGYRNVVGVDPAPACVRRASEVEGASAFVGTLFDMPVKALGADCVVLSHVLEHVQDVRGALHGVRAALRLGGVIYVEVPDATRYAEFPTAPFQDFNTEHINHFSPASLRNALEAVSFGVRAAAPKLIEAAAGVPYPACYAVAERTDEPRRPSHDATLRPAIEAYVRMSAVAMARVRAEIDRLLAAHDRLVVWGVGQTTFKLLSQTALGGAAIIAFADTSSTYHGRTLRGVPIVAPAELRGHPPHPILVGSLVNRASIVDSIGRLGLPNKVLTIGVTA
jgi:SAM-dependent methyltransferase